MEVISMKQHGPAMKFNISQKNVDKEDISEDYNIHNFVIVRFKARINSTYGRCIYIAVKKHEYAKDWTFTVNVTCDLCDIYESNLSCSENWSVWICSSCTAQWCVDVFIKINITKIYSTTANVKFNEDDSFTDFQLTADDGSVAVHRIYLAVHSDVFKTMLQGQWKETAQGRVELKGVTRQTLQHFKDFIYLGTLPDEDEGLCALLLLATRYLVENLMRGCMMKVLQTITAENLDSHIEFAVENQMHELKDNIFEKIPAEVFASAYAIKINALMDKKESSSSPDEE